MKFLNIKLVLIILLGSAVAFGQSPDITELEYYFDTDPGFGNGTSVAVSADTVTNTTFNLDISGLSAGIHYAFIRAKDENDVWSFVTKMIVHKVETLPVPIADDIVELEYFFDTDPGYGNGTPVAITADTITSTTFDIDISGLDAGYHKVYFRTMNENNVWSLVYAQNIVKVSELSAPSSIDIVAAEYFFDTDPGYGNGTPVSVSSGLITNTTFDIDISGLDAGYHKVYFRTMSEADIWSLAYIHNIVKVVVDPANVASDLVEVEYFIDTDPGFGNGTAVAVSPADSIVDFTFGVDVSSLSTGEYDLYVRVKNEEDSWSLINIIPFEVTEVELTALLEGPYNGSDMNTDLNASNNLPLDQPFNTTPWNYSGAESVASIPNANIVDWVLLETRNGSDASAALISLASSQQAVFILNDGSIVGLDGSSNLQFNSGNLATNFVAIHHRNHISVLSNQNLNYDGGSFSYDFTTNAGQAYGSVQKDLGSGVYGLYAGNANGDSQIDADDLTEKWDLETGYLGYFNGDLNMDTQVNNQDKNEVWYPNIGITSFETLQEFGKIKTIGK